MPEKFMKQACRTVMLHEFWHFSPSITTALSIHVLSYDGLTRSVMRQTRTQACG